MPIFAPGTFQGLNAAYAQQHQYDIDKQLAEERRQLMESRQFQLEQAREAQARGTSERESGMKGLEAIMQPSPMPPPVAQTPEPGQPSVPNQIQPPAMQGQYGGMTPAPFPQPMVGQNIPAPVQQRQPQGQMFVGDPMKIANEISRIPNLVDRQAAMNQFMQEQQQQRQQIPPYRTVGGMAQGQQPSADQVTGMAPPPVTQDQTTSGLPTLKGMWAKWEAAGTPMEQRLAALQLPQVQNVFKMQGEDQARELKFLTEQLRERHYAAMEGQGQQRIDNAGTRAAKKQAAIADIGDTSLTGTAYLQTIPQEDRNAVKAIAEGREKISDAGYRGADRLRLMKMVNQYNPEYSGRKFAIKQAVEKDFTSGKSANNITALNTAIGHMDTMNDLVKAVGAGDVQFMNKLISAAKTQFGHPEVTNAELASIAIGDEMMRVFRQVGASENEAAAWRSKFDAAVKSPKQMEGVLKTASTLLESRIESLNDQWKRGTDSDKGYPNLISKKSRSVLKKLGVDIDKDSSGESSSSGIPSGWSVKER